MTTPSAARREMSLELVVQNARRYELGPLLIALAGVGVPLSRVYFDGRPLPTPNDRAVLSRPRLAPEGRSVLGARIRPVAGEPSVTVHLAGGLWGPLSPLPSYFQTLLAEEVLAESLGSLLHVLDDSLFRARARYADAKRGLSPSSSLDPRLGEAVLNTSPLYVDWLFRQVFPELRVQVRRSELPRPLKLERVLLGSVSLGQCALDGRTQLPASSLDVLLTTSFDDDLHSSETWAELARERLSRLVFSHFQRHPLSLRVVLRVLASRSQARLAAARVGQALVVNARPPFELTLHSGYVESTEAVTALSTSRRASPRRHS